MSGSQPCRTAGTTWSHGKLSNPWPRSNFTPAAVPRPGRGAACPPRRTGGRPPWPGIATYMCVTMSPGRSFSRTSCSERPLGPEGAEIDHHGELGLRPRRDRAIDGDPLGPVVMRGLDPDDHLGELQRHGGGPDRVHVLGELLVGPPRHPPADDVQQRQHAGLRPIDDPLLEVGERPPARRPGVDDGRHAAAEGVRVGDDAAGRRRSPVSPVPA